MLAGTPCDDQIACTENFCWSINCPDGPGDNCIITEKVTAGDDGGLLSGALSCLGFGHELQGTCEGSCGDISPDNCYCDEECFGFGDCCADVCTACSDLGGCGGCVVNLCPKDGEADQSDCTVRELPLAEVIELLADNQEGYECIRRTDIAVCDDANSCTNDTCNYAAAVGESGCGYASFVPGTSCTGKEVCAEENGGVCVASSNEAGVICSEVMPKLCPNNNPCEEAICNPLTGECDAVPAFEPGEQLACNVAEPEISSCGSGTCQACGPTEFGCMAARCVASGEGQNTLSNPFGWPCQTDGDCESADGQDWQCIGTPGAKNCVLPCAGVSCKECMEQENTVPLRTEVFWACAGACGADIVGLAPEEMLNADFLDGFWDAPNVGFLTAQPSSAHKATLEGLINLALVKDLPMGEQPIGTVFGTNMYSCQAPCESLDLLQAPLCNCGKECLEANDCCPDACDACGTGADKDQCVAGAALNQPEWASNDAVGLKTDFQQCAECIATITLKFAGDNCQQECDVCSGLSSGFLSAATCGSISVGASGGVEEACVQPCTVFGDSGVKACYEGTCTTYPGLTELPK